jgi:transcriptional regulator with XRE-family HTH domain
MSIGKSNKKSQPVMQKPNPSPLCAAVKHVRQVYGESQQRFAERLGVSLVSVNRWELGHQEPGDLAVLLKLQRSAWLRRLEKEANLFAEAVQKSFEPYETISPSILEFLALGAPSAAKVEVFSHSDKLLRLQDQLPALREWRLRLAARLAVLSFPELLPGMERAAGPVLRLIDERLERLDEATVFDFAALEDELKIAVQQYALKKQNKKRKNP